MRHALLVRLLSADEMGRKQMAAMSLPFSVVAARMKAKNPGISFSAICAELSRRSANSRHAKKTAKGKNTRLALYWRSTD